jgi:hypothetical protein
MSNPFIIAIMIVIRKHGRSEMKKIKEINPLDLVKDQYQNLKEKFRSARDDKEKKVIFRRLVNLLGVMQFLISINKGP